MPDTLAQTARTGSSKPLADGAGHTFKSPQQAQRFLSAHAMIFGHFRPRRHLMTAAQHRRARAKAFRVWRKETSVQIAV
ncbi:hypothetical protein ACE7GA_00315 [Roseomonas sp. CCTCC AB2023176]|uniref:hypothetical protein n=1 Tax=Roseomonas sp. CCTCC AB2023176 TaxID=3342640 RepID=UPI0035D5C910